MGEFKLNIIDNERAINGIVHDHLGPAALASLTAEPENIGELESALRRFMIWEMESPIAGLGNGEDLTEAEGGLIAIDLSSRTVYMDDLGPDDPNKVPHVWIETPLGEEDGFFLPFRLSDDWLLLDSLDEFAAKRLARRAERAANPPIDYRATMYGAPLVEFIARECATVARPATPPQSIEDDPAVPIHKKWYMTPREDLGGKTPRDVLFFKQDFINWELEYRNRQWSFAGVCPPHIPPETNAYRFSGFGTHEWVVYYYLVRHLIDRGIGDAERSADLAAEAARLAELQEAYWNEPDPESFSRTPRSIVESERRRIGISMSAKEIMVDENCPCCQMMAEEFDTPTFWHLDGCNMDECFEFSYHETREEFEKEQREWAERSAEIEAENERKRQEFGEDWFKLEMEENYRQFMTEHGDSELIDDGEDEVPF
jgi:Zn ribbon nucleic-acid-binding protein